MYKFTNGLVVFDEKTRDDYLKVGFKLIEEIKKPANDNEELNGNETNNDRIVEEESTRSNKKTRKDKK